MSNAPAPRPFSATVTRFFARQWLAAVVWLPVGLILACIVVASIAPYDGDWTYSRNVGWLMGSLFDGRRINVGRTKMWALTFVPFVLVLLWRVTAWARKNAGP